MERWGKHYPIWNEQAGKVSFEDLRQDLEVDTAIIGAGITGLLQALLLTERGQKVALVTDGTIGFGTTGSSTGHLTQIQDRPLPDLHSAFGDAGLSCVLNSSRDAINLIAEKIRGHNLDCGFGYTPGIKYSENGDDTDALIKEMTLARDHGVQAEVLKDSPMPFPVACGVKYDQQAFLNPLQFLWECGRILKARSVPIYERSRVLKIEDGTPARVHTEFGSITAKNVVMATHTPIGVYISIHTRVAPYFSYVMAVKLASYPPAALYWDSSHPYHYLRPLTPGSDIWIIGGKDHKTGQVPSTLEKYIELEDYIQSHFKVRELTHYWGNEYYEPVDGLPYIGRIPFTTSLYTGTGFSGNGLTFGAITAMLLTDLLTGHESKYASSYDPGRIKPVASASHFIKENVNVAKWLVSDRLAHHEIAAIKNIAPNEGKLIEIGGKKIAVYRNEKGGVHAMSSTCTHMGCTVHWNTAEKTWDCPCHGGRFTPTGYAFEGPPMEDLVDVPFRTEKNPDVETSKVSVTPGFSPVPDQLGLT